METHRLGIMSVGFEIGTTNRRRLSMQVSPIAAWGGSEHGIPGGNENEHEGAFHVGTIGGGRREGCVCMCHW